jgi:Zn-dependent peptidase ImmA (M78 family)
VAIRNREARKRAQQMLKMANAKEPPVDPKVIAELLGFTVLEYPLPYTTSGLTFIEEGVKVIGVNSQHAPTRQRFSIAHELGHYLSGHEAYDSGGTHVDDRPSYLDPQHRQEIEANEFAAELLMPTAWLKRDVAELGVDGAMLAKRYGVSEQAMWIQLLDLQLV